MPTKKHSITEDTMPKIPPATAAKPVSTTLKTNETPPTTKGAIAKMPKVSKTSKAPPPKPKPEG